MFFIAVFEIKCELRLKLRIKILRESVRYRHKRNNEADIRVTSLAFVLQQVRVGENWYLFVVTAIKDAPCGRMYYPMKQ